MTNILSTRNLIIHYSSTLIICCALLMYNILHENLPFIPGLIALGSFILYYDLTNLYDRKFAIISFILNFILLQVELLVLFMPTQDNMYLGLILILVLFATNKILIDIVLQKLGQKPKEKLRIDGIIERYKETGEFKYK